MQTIIITLRRKEKGERGNEKKEEKKREGMYGINKYSEYHNKTIYRSTL